MKDMSNLEISHNIDFRNDVAGIEKIGEARFISFCSEHESYSTDLVWASCCWMQNAILWCIFT